MASPYGGMMNFPAAIDMIEERLKIWLSGGARWRSMSESERTTFEEICVHLSHAVSEPISRSDWLTIAGKLRIVFDKDYPVE